MQRKLWLCFLFITGPEKIHLRQSELNPNGMSWSPPHPTEKSQHRLTQPSNSHSISPNFPRFFFQEKKLKPCVFQQKPVWRDLSTEPCLWRDLRSAGQVSQWVFKQPPSTCDQHQECHASTFSCAWYGGGHSLFLCRRTISWSRASRTPGKEGCPMFLPLSSTWWKRRWCFFKEWLKWRLCTGLPDSLRSMGPLRDHNEILGWVRSLPFSWVQTIKYNK